MLDEVGGSQWLCEQIIEAVGGRPLELAQVAFESVNAGSVAVVKAAVVGKRHVLLPQYGGVVADAAAAVAHTMDGKLHVS